MGKPISPDSVGKWLDTVAASDPEAKAVRRYVRDLEKKLEGSSATLKAFRADSEFLSAAVKTLLYKTFPPNTPSQEVIKMAKMTLEQHEKLVKQR